ncbi:alpha/beta hydrolase family protein [Tunicatimonas pelagia]|uniref:alpha/beta hydrolase family protein n=1 Tax=Tunicatimonas pelagia TaxID=931531 RepID=UPI0026660C29|nr:lipase family protein [Tunicatimonas pelagia]WKN42726.1 lipase family protein [Tunicatimonas pelagia]
MLRIFNSVSSFFVGLMFLLIVASCQTEDDEPVIVNEYLVDYEEVASFSGQELRVLAAFTGFGQYQDLIEYGLTLYKLNYFTEFQGERVEASGVVALPQGTEQFPLLLGARGTITNNQRAPSNLNFSQNSSSGFELFASFGFFSVVPDYIGFGASSGLVHPYFDYASSARSSVDMLKATREFLTEQEIAFSDNLFLTGYSQGGYIAVATLKYLDENPGELPNTQVVATAAGAGGYNIRQTMEMILQETMYPAPVNLAFLVYAYQQTNNWNRPLTDFFQEPFASQIPSLFDGNNSTGFINTQLPNTLNDLFQPDFITNVRNGTESEFLAALEENSVHGWAPQTPLRLFHDIKDEVVPAEVSESTFEVMQQNGAAEVLYFPYDLAPTHQEAAQPMYLQTIPWFNSLREF